MQAPNPITMDLALKAICLTIVPFMLPATQGDPAKASNVIADMIQAYEPADTIELDLIGRIVGFGLAAMDTIRLSVTDPDLPPATILRYRSAAANLSRSAEKCRTTLMAGRAAAQSEAASPRSAKSAPAKPAAPKSRAAQSASDVSLEKTAAHARTVLDRLDRLHAEWAAIPNVIPMHSPPSGEDAKAATAESVRHDHGSALSPGSAPAFTPGPGQGFAGAHNDAVKPPSTTSTWPVT